MCGICGIVGRVEAPTLKRMTTVLSHRGPDDSGVATFRDRRGGFGHTRLSILDLSSRGHQPMADRGGGLWITYNGEIYNYRELRADLEGDYAFQSDTDTEVILAAYRAMGPECLGRMNGMFALAIWDEEKGELWAARDRLGIKPFYYALTAGGLVFASEIKAILASGLVEPEPDWAALATPVMYQVEPGTGFKNIKKLPPGHMLRYAGGKLVVEPYWRLEVSESLSDETSLTEEMDALLEDAVEKQMISDVPVGLLLSGGLDSSLVLSLMARHSGQAVKTFTIKFGEKDKKFEQMPDDSRYARQVARQFECEHHEIEVEPDVVNLLPKMMWHLDEPLADPASINTYLISQAARDRGVVVLLNGMGGDEVFGGYRKHLACLLADTYQRWVPGPGRRMLRRILEIMPAATASRGIRTIRWAKRFVNFADLPRDMRHLASSSLASADYEALFAGGNAGAVDYANSLFTSSFLDYYRQVPGSYLTKMCASDVRYYMADHNLNYSDKCTMAAGVEGRPALIDHRVVELMFRMAPSLRIKGRQQKHLLKRVAERHLPREIIHRPKAPFGSPLRSWIRGPLAGMVEDYLAPEALKRRGLYNPDYVWKKIRLDRDGVEDNAHLVWTALCVEIWFRKFMDRH